MRRRRALRACPASLLITVASAHEQAPWRYRIEPESPCFQAGDEWLLHLTSGCSRDHTPYGRLPQSPCPPSVCTVIVQRHCAPLVCTAVVHQQRAGCSSTSTSCASPAPKQAAIDEAIRTTQFIRNKAVRLWMDGHGVSANDLQVLCARLAHEFDFAARLNSQARQAAASRAWAAIERFYTNCREKRPGKKGYPRFQRDCRSVEYKQTGWQLDAAGKRLTLTDGGGIGQVRLIGSRDLATFPREPIKRVRLLRRADGYYAQFVLQVERRVSHAPTGSALGIDVGIAAYVTDSDGATVANPRFIRLAEARLKRYQRRLSRRSVSHKRGKKPRNNHAARQRARHNQYPPAHPAHPAHPATTPPTPPPHPPPHPPPPPLPPRASRPTGGRRSNGWAGCT